MLSVFPAHDTRPINYLPMPPFLPTISSGKRERQKELDLAWLGRSAIVLEGPHAGKIGKVEDVFDVSFSLVPAICGTYFTIRFVSGEQCARHDQFFVMMER